MTENIIFSSLHVFAAILQFLLAGLTLLTNPKGFANRSIAAFLAFLGLISLSFNGMINAFSFSDAFPWIVLQAIPIYTIGPAIMLVALATLRPKHAAKPWINLPLLIWAVLPTVSIALDISGISEALLGRALFLDISDPNNYTGGVISVSQFATGMLRPLILAGLIALPLVSMVYPALFVIIKDRKTDPGNARFAWMLFVTILASSFFSLALRDTFSFGIGILLQNFVYSVGFTFIGLQKTNKRINIRGLPGVLANFSMFYKLMFVPIAIVIPALVLISVVSLTFFSNNITNIVGEDLNTLAVSQANLVSGEIDGQIEMLHMVTGAPATNSAITSREEKYSGMSLEDIQLEINQRNTDWISGVEESILLNFEPPPNFSMFLNAHKSFPTVTLIDKYGGLISSSYLPSNYDFSNMPWWEIVKSSGKPFVGLPKFDSKTGLVIVDFAVPIMTTENGVMNVDAVLLASYSLARITESMMLPNSSLSPNVAIFSEFGNWVPAGDPELYSNPFLNWQLLTNSPDRNWQILPYDGIDSVISWAKVENENIANGIGWNIVTHISTNNALSPVVSAQFGAVLLTILIIIGSVIVTIILARLITKPLQELTKTANKILSGEKNVRAEVIGTDEIGTLSSTFNNMTEELNKLVSSLETTVSDRTEELERRSLQMETSSVVAREAAAIRDVVELMNSVTQLISERFNFYHAGIFLLDDRGEYAVLSAANSDGGKRMLNRGHKLQVGKVGVVGYSAGVGEPRIAQDVGADVVYYDNPDMPDTRSELALPLKIRQQVIGVLDVQSKRANAFSREITGVLETLADQIALAIENARLLQTSQQSLEELQFLYGQQVSQAWQRRLSNQEISHSYNSLGLNLDIERQEPEAESSPNDENILNKEILLRGQAIGNIELVRGEGIDGWSEDELELVEEVLDQTALALDNARLVNQIRLRSDQIQLLQEITALSASLLDEKALLGEVTERLQEGLGLLHCGVYLIDNEKNVVIQVASKFDSSVMKQDMVSSSSAPIEGNEVTLEVIRSKKTQVIYDIQSDPKASVYSETLAPRGTLTTAILPIIIRGDVIGIITLDVNDPSRTFDEEDVNLFNQISTQVSTAVEGSRLFQAEQRGRKAAAALLEITQIASSSIDLRKVLATVSQRSAQAVSANRCTIFLLDENSRQLTALMSQFADGRKTDGKLWEKFKSMRSIGVDENEMFEQVLSDLTPNIWDKSLMPGIMDEEWIEPFEIEKLLIVPLISQNKAAGLMVFDYTNPNEKFDLDQIELAQTIAGQIATTIDNANLVQQTLEKVQREREVAEITAKLRSSNDPDEIIKTAIEELREVLTIESQNTQSDTKKENQNGQ